MRSEGERLVEERGPESGRGIRERERNKGERSKGERDGENGKVVGEEMVRRKLGA